LFAFIILKKRGNYGEERYERIEFQHLVKEKFMHMKQMDTADASIPWFVLDATKTIEQLQTEVESIADTIIARAATQPVQKLWTN
jgi:dTMP kinase